VAALAAFLAAFSSRLNCNGVETSARINSSMATALGLVIVLVLAVLEFTEEQPA
jgi:hypothetical protein